MFHRRSNHANNFNPRSREGSDPSSSFVPSPIVQFQSTLPRRERLKRDSVSRHGHNFNPRSREGSDLLALLASLLALISIHAPAKGATFQPGLSASQDGHFNPRSREGSDFCKFIICRAYHDFNPRSREGSDFIADTSPVNPF